METLLGESRAGECSFVGTEEDCSDDLSEIDPALTASCSSLSLRRRASMSSKKESALAAHSEPEVPDPSPEARRGHRRRRSYFSWEVRFSDDATPRIFAVLASVRYSALGHIGSPSCRPMCMAAPLFNLRPRSERQMKQRMRCSAWGSSCSFTTGLMAITAGASSSFSLEVANKRGLSPSSASSSASPPVAAAVSCPSSCSSAKAAFIAFMSSRIFFLSSLKRLILVSMSSSCSSLASLHLLLDEEDSTDEPSSLTSDIFLAAPVAKEVSASATDFTSPTTSRSGSSFSFSSSSSSSLSSSSCPVSSITELSCTTLTSTSSSTGTFFPDPSPSSQLSSDSSSQ